MKTPDTVFTVAGLIMKVGMEKSPLLDGKNRLYLDPHHIVKNSREEVIASIEEIVNAISNYGAKPVGYIIEEPVQDGSLWLASIFIYGRMDKAYVRYDVDRGVIGFNASPIA
jgi:hypothetical protein